MDLIIDSADRLSGTSSKFVYQLPTPIEDVRSITLKRAAIYNTDYLLNDNNNHIDVIIDSQGITHTVVLPIGDVSLQDIADAITAQVPELTVTVNDTLHKFQFSSSVPIRFDVHRNPECAQLLGVTEDDYGNNFIASRVYQLRPTRYYRIYVREFSSYSRDYFLLLNNAASAHLSVLDTQPSQTICCDVSRLSQLTVDIRDEFDNQVNLNGTDVLLHVMLK